MGFWTQNLVYQKWPDQIFPIENFVFSHDGHFGLGRRGGGFGGGPPPWVLIILKKPCFGGHQWSGCSVRTRLQLRLPHSFHRLLSIVTPPAHSVPPVWLGVLPP